jgi:hypothetical protein
MLWFRSCQMVCWKSLRIWFWNEYFMLVGVSLIERWFLIMVWSRANLNMLFGLLKKLVALVGSRYLGRLSLISCKDCWVNRVIDEMCFGQLRIWFRVSVVFLHDGHLSLVYKEGYLWLRYCLVGSELVKIFRRKLRRLDFRWFDGGNVFEEKDLLLERL